MSDGEGFETGSSDRSLLSWNLLHFIPRLAPGRSWPEAERMLVPLSRAPLASSKPYPEPERPVLGKTDIRTKTVPWLIRTKTLT